MQKSSKKASLLMDLLQKKAFNKRSAVFVSEYISPELIPVMDDLLQKDRIDITPDARKIYLTKIGMIIAFAYKQELDDDNHE